MKKVLLLLLFVTLAGALAYGALCQNSNGGAVCGTSCQIQLGGGGCTCTGQCSEREYELVLQ